MDAGIINLIIQIVAGLIGGTAVGSRMENVNLGGVGNAIAGALGGVGGGQLLGALMPALSGAEGLDIGSIIGQLVGGGAGGAILTIIAGLIKNAMASR
jgi:hypothetical protein